VIADRAARRRLSALGVAVAVAIAAGAICSAPASAARLTISPAPGTPAASPETQISILGAAPRRIRSVDAAGAATGPHPGKLRSYSGDRGASFIPDEPFEQGERVTATVRVRGRTPVRFEFTIARLGPIQPFLNLRQRQPGKLQHFVSEPDLVPPKTHVLQNTGGTRGRIFLTPLPSPVVHPEDENPISINPIGPGGPMIVDGNGELVWFRQLEPPEVAANLRLQRYRGRRVLTWWEGGVTPSAFGLGRGVIANRSYETIDTVHAGNGYGMDIHELTVTPGGDALFTVYSPILVHLPGTPAGELSPLMDSIVQQVDVRTGLVVWEWHSYGHISLADSYATPENSASYDAYHINSIQKLRRGQVLISARDTSAIYKIDRASGDIRWTLGGKASTFDLGGGAEFWLQHDAQLLPGGRVSMYDDQAGPPPKRPFSRGLVLKLNHKRETAKVEQSYFRSRHTSAQSEGSVQTRRNGNVFVGFGSAPFFSEFSPGGRLLYDASLPKDDGSYRVYRHRWQANPKTRPTLAVRRTSAQKVSVFASWNGATAVRTWEVLAGSGARSLQPVKSRRRTGFETRIRVPTTADTFAVRALDADGKVLATSPPAHPS
jgi:hypothetical protein